MDIEPRGSHAILTKAQHVRARPGDGRSEACQNVVPLKPRVALPDGLDIVVGGEHPKNVLHRQPTAPNDGPATVAAEALRSGYQAHEHSKEERRAGDGETDGRANHRGRGQALCCVARIRLESRGLGPAARTSQRGATAYPRSLQQQFSPHRDYNPQSEAPEERPWLRPAANHPAAKACPRRPNHQQFSSRCDLSVAPTNLRPRPRRSGDHQIGRLDPVAVARTGATKSAALAHLQPIGRPVAGAVYFFSRPSVCARTVPRCLERPEHLRAVLPLASICLVSAKKIDEHGKH
jgi:hypothetical protein